MRRLCCLRGAGEAPAGRRAGEGAGLDGAGLVAPDHRGRRPDVGGTGRVGRRARCRFHSAGGDGRAGRGGGGTGRRAGPWGGAAARWFLCAVAVGRRCSPVAGCWPQTVRNSLLGQVMSGNTNSLLALGGRAVTGWGVLIGPFGQQLQAGSGDDAPPAVAGLHEVFARTATRGGNPHRPAGTGTRRSPHRWVTAV